MISYLVEVLLRIIYYIVLALGLFYGGVPVALYSFPSLARWFVFLAFCALHAKSFELKDIASAADKRPFRNYSRPARDYKMKCARNFYLENDGVRIGIWQITAAHIRCRSDNCESEKHDWEWLLSTPYTPIVLYAHGNSYDRAHEYRCALYNVLTECGYNVLALDYRGFGDSTGSPTEEGAAADVELVYNWALEHAGENPIYIWGHSLGTGIGTLATVNLCKNNNSPVGLILEAPFNKLVDVVEHHPMTLPFRWLPHFEMCFMSPLRNAGISFNTENRLKNVKCPVMILHAHDDETVPFLLTKRLLHRTREHGVRIQLHEFPTSRRYGHNMIYQAPELPTLIAEFFGQCVQLRKRVQEAK